MADGGATEPDPLTGGQPTFSIDGGGAFLLQLLQKSPQPSLLPTQPQPINRRHVDPAVAAMGPTLPFNLGPSPVDPTPILSASPSAPFPHMLFHRGNDQQIVPPLNYHQSFNLSAMGHDLGPNQGYQGGINGGIREDSTINLMAYDAFQRNNQQFAPPMNQNFNVPAMERDFGTNQGYRVGANGGMREMYMGNQKAHDLSQSTNQQFIPLLNHHQRPDLSTNQGFPNGYNGNMRVESGNQRVQDARMVFDGMPQREREERRQQRPIHPSRHFDNYQGFNHSNKGNIEEMRNDKYNPRPVLNLHNSRDFGKWINERKESSLHEENTVRLHKFEISSKQSEIGFVSSNQSNASFVASSSDNSKDEERDEDLLTEHLTESLVIEERNAQVTSKTCSRNKDFRSDFSRGHHVSSQRIRIQRRTMQCRRDIDIFAPAFVSIYESLVPPSEEIAKQRKLINSLNKLISTEWPHARLHLYGSCANSFGVSNSDIDVCLSINARDSGKPEIILKLAEILEAGNLQNIQALTRARVPIVKMMDPDTGLSCDICINNLLAVVNTKLLKDYAIIDPRLRQLAFIVKHWAKSRRVNETYQGTLSSYAYVIMCIFFLQNRRPAILPCLQAMEATYVAKIDNREYAYCDKVENLRGIGARNRESISRLVRGFFHYWAYQHDYTSDVISIRTGSIISKHEKDWTRRVGNDRHLICIEDPFEISHDLGRVVDKFTIKILREEFERAANILQYDPNPTVALFEKYVPPPKNVFEEEIGDEFEGLNLN